MAGITTCANCGTIIEEAPSIAQEDRKPCRACGSTGRSFSITVESGVMVISASVGAVLVGEEVPSGNLLLKTVIVPGKKTSEGQLIEAVSVPWFEIVAHIGKDPAAMFQISARTWEEIIAGAYHRAGWDEVTLTPRSGDLGRDVIAVKKAIGTVRVIDQVKAYGAGNLVTANDVRALMGVLQGDPASKGFLTTTSDFAPKLPDDPLIRPFIPSRLELVNGETLIKKLAELAKKT